MEKIFRWMYNKRKVPLHMDKEGECMEIRDGQWRKPLLGISATLLLAMSVGAWYADDADKPPLVLPAAKDDEKRGNTTEIIGLRQAADPGRELRNPFTWLHETEQESGMASRESKSPSVAAGLQNSSPSAAGSLPAGNNEKQNSGSPGISLCGIVEGGGQRLALLRVGNSTVTAAQGEMAADWQVTDIGTATVTVERAGQVLGLQMKAEVEER